ncbi:fibronectin type III domain-containing protein [Zongyangia hominis]|uniref:Fibronectin type III domain-containing protein n=1 Tax=Zongyangia hominis TaxID=2763677 RepID=A0A926ED29_9FIRM|nr:fibronectin type III domain-containing protein [Zongyangia hominis]MBC8569901.1 fibronectin type III domain-containing protein [Zongyangia hominis]
MVSIRKKILSVLLSLALIVGVMAPTVVAQGETTTTLTVTSAAPDAKYHIIGEDPIWGAYDYYGKEYDGSAVIDVALTLSGAEAGDTVAATATATLSSANKGDYNTVDLTDITLTGNPDGKYSIADSQAGVTLTEEFTIDPKTFPLIVTAESREYDTSNSVTIASLSFTKPAGYDGTTESLSASDVMFAMLTDGVDQVEGPGITDVGDMQYADLALNSGFNFGNFEPETIAKLSGGKITPSPLSFSVSATAGAAKVLPGVKLTAEVKDVTLSQAILGQLTEEAAVAAELKKATDGLTYQWLRDGTAIEGANTATYTVAEEDRNHEISCKVSASGNYAGDVTSTVFTVSDREMLTGSVAITGTPAVGNTLTAAATLNNSDPTYTWQWYRGNDKIADATNAAYEVTKDDRGQTLRAVVVGTGNFQGGPEGAMAVPAEKPAAPGNIQVDAKSNSCTVTWDAPADDGGSPLTGYEVQFGLPGQSTGYIVGLVNSYDFRDLQPETQYEVRVQVKNAVGSTTSAPVTFTTPKRAMDETTTTVEGLEASYPYTGSQIAPVIVVKDGSTPLTVGTHYDLVYGENKEVGEGTITINFKGAYTGSVIKTFTIVQNAPSLAAPTAKGAVTFDGLALVPGEDFNEAVLSGGTSVSGSVFYVATEANTKPADVPTKNDLPYMAGTYYIWAYFTGDDHNASTWSDASLALTIGKKALDPSVIQWPTTQGGVYDPNKTLADYPLAMNSYGTFAWSNPDTVPTVAVTSYEVTFTPNAYTLQNYNLTGVTTTQNVALAITAAQGSGSVTLEGWTYGDAPKTPVPVSATNGTDGVTYQYKSTAEGAQFTSDVPTDAGEYLLEATFPASGNYQSVTAQTFFTIAKKALTDADIIWPTAQGGAYDPNKTLADYVLNGTSAYGAFAWSNPATVPTVAVTSYSVTFTPNAADEKNYDFTGVTTTQNVDLAITAAQGSGSVTLEGWTYGDAPKTPVPVSATNGTEGVTYQYKSAAEGAQFSDTVPADAGDYVVKASFPASGNYAACMAEANFTIAKKALTDADITWPTAQGGAYDPNKTLADYALDGTSAYGAFAWTNPATVPTVAVTSYSVTFTPSEDAKKNYDFTNVTLTKNVDLSIGTLEGSGSVTLEGWTYGDAPKTPVPVSATNGTDGVTYQYKSAAEGAQFSDTVPTDAGDYVVKASFPAKDGYAACTAEANFTIAVKEITVTPDAGQSKRTGQDDPSFTYTVSPALVGDDSLTGALGRVAGEEPGTYAFTLGTLANGNYRLVLADAVFTITDPQVEVIGKAPAADESLKNDPNKGTIVEGMLNNAAAQAAPTGLAEAAAGNLEITGDTDLFIDVEITDVTLKNGKVESVIFEAAPYWAGEDGVPHLLTNDQLNGGEITFRLPVPAEVTQKYAKVVHYLSNGTTETMYLTIQEENGGKFVVVKTKSFSRFEMSFTNVKPNGSTDKPSIPGGGSDWKWPTGSGSSSDTSGKGNPSTGANDFLAGSIALAAIAGLTTALSIKRKKK